MKKAYHLLRFVEIMGISKCRKESEINKARELSENNLANSTQFNINEKSNKQKYVEIFTKSLLLEASSIKNIYQKSKTHGDVWWHQRLGYIIVLIVCRINTNPKFIFQTYNNTEPFSKKLTEIIKFESKATEHGTVMEDHVKLQAISILKVARVVKLKIDFYGVTFL